MLILRILIIIKIVLLSSLLFSFNNRCSAQIINSSYKIMFWNLENFFDPFNDPSTSDDEFTPKGQRRWGWNRFAKKRNDIAKVIISTGEAVSSDNNISEINYPVVIGLAEVENHFVLEQLVKATPLAMLDYKIIHRDSPDERGIDVALLYRRKYFKPVSINYYPVITSDTSFKTRLILYVKGVLEELDTLHVFVNHWPSKFGGELISGPKRQAAAKKLRIACDSIFQSNNKANIVIMGDFNDTPDSDLFKKVTGNGVDNSNLYNLAIGIRRLGEGTIKYRASWELIDMFFVSSNLLDRNEPVCCLDCAMRIFRPEFLFEEDKIYLGKKPFRCYIGPRYNGGISDHLPVILTIDKMWENPSKIGSFVP